MGRLEDHPGFLGFTSSGVVALHADWPTYPEEHGPSLALLWLTAHPVGTVFRPISDIDRCVLLHASVDGRPLPQDPFAKGELHVAVWHEDLLELARSAYVSGVAGITELRWQELTWPVPLDKPLYWEGRGGQLMKVRFQEMGPYDDEDESFPEFSPEGLSVTASGRAEVLKLLPEKSEVFDVLGARVSEIFALGYFDSAIREACVSVEDRMRAWLGTRRYGEKLIQDFFDRIRREYKLLESQRRLHQSDLRVTFRFIRNEHMHQRLELDEAEASAVLFRVARVPEFVRSVSET